MWIVVAVVIVIIGAYNAGVRSNQIKEAKTQALLNTLPVMSLGQIAQVRVSEL